MDPQSSFRQRLIGRLVLGAILGVIVGFVVYMKMEVKDSIHQITHGSGMYLHKGGKWTVVGISLSMCWLIALALTAQDWLRMRKRARIALAMGETWLTPWCQTLTNSHKFHFEPLEEPLTLPSGSRLKVCCAARHDSLGKHCLMLHVKTLPGFNWGKLMETKQEVEECLLASQKRNSLVVWWIIEGEAVVQRESLGSWTDQFTSSGACFLWVMGIDPAGKKAHIFSDSIGVAPPPDTKEKLRMELHAAGYEGLSSVKEKNGDLVDVRTLDDRLLIKVGA